MKRLRWSRVSFLTIASWRVAVAFVGMKRMPGLPGASGGLAPSCEEPALLADLPDIKGTRKQLAANRAPRKSPRKPSVLGGLSKKIQRWSHSDGGLVCACQTFWEQRLACENKLARVLCRGDSADRALTQNFLAGFVILMWATRVKKHCTALLASLNTEPACVFRPLGQSICSSMENAD